MSGQSCPRPLRAASYCRTSGEGQRDNTSIPRQKDANTEFIGRNDWIFIRHYVDESKTGSKIEGRDEFQRMMRDAANDLFDVIVVFDIKRFARDGFDIISNANSLRKLYGIYVVDTKNQFDNRDRRNTLTNYVQAGLSEQEKLEIMERLFGGRLRRAQEGLPWTSLPFGRSFIVTSRKPKQGHWEVNEDGHRIRTLLERYVEGERLIDLAKEFGFYSPAHVLAIVRRSQLSGTYVATFSAPDIDIRDHRIEVPAVPQVITTELEQRVRAKMAHNRKCNKEHLNKYFLTGFMFCAQCGRSMTGGQRTSGKNKYRYYRHGGDKPTTCNIKAIRADAVEPQVLQYLYQFFLDQPALEEALRAAMPSSDDRAALEKDLKQCEKSQGRVVREIQNLVNAIAGGADLSLMLEKQSELIAQRDILAARHSELSASLASMPNFEHVKRDATFLRIWLMQEHQGKAWQDQPYGDVRRFLGHLFGDDCKATGNGILVSGRKNSVTVKFKGVMDFNHYLANGRPQPDIYEEYARQYNEELERMSPDAANPGGAPPHYNHKPLLGGCADELERVSDNDVKRGVATPRYNHRSL